MRYFRHTASLAALAFALGGVSISLQAQTGSASDSTVLLASPSTLSQGGSVSLTATVTPTNAGTSPTGTVKFLYGSQYLGAASLSQGSATLSGPTTGIVPGTYDVTAQYEGDANYAPSLSSAVPVTISPYATTTSVSVAHASVIEGAHDNITVTVANSAGTKTPSGAVNILIGSTSYGPFPLSNGTAYFWADSTGIAAGTYNITASYAGDTYNGASTSSTIQAAVRGTTVTTVSFAGGGLAVGQTASISATLTAPSGGSTDGSTITFTAGSTTLGTAVTSGGVATLTGISTSALSPGTYSVTASFAGSTLFAPSSASASITVGPAFTVAPASVALSPSGTTQFSLSPVPAGTVTWYVNGIAGGNSTVGTIDANGNFTAPATLASPTTENITATVSAEPTYTPTAAAAYVLLPGAVASTANKQVAAYTINLPAGSSVSVNFGTTTSYGLNTWTVPSPTGGGDVTVLVAGMLPQTLYHIQGVVSLPGSATYTDIDRTFTTGKPVATIINPSFYTNPDYTPQDGVELIDVFTGAAYIYDLGGNPLWAYYTHSTESSSGIQPLKQLADGNLLIGVTPESAFPVDGTVLLPDTTIDILEVDLTGATVRDLSLATLQTNLNAFGYVNSLGDQIALDDMHHEVTVNPTNGHWLVMANTTQTFASVAGETGPQTALGDVVIDVDPANNFAVDWVWNEFDWLDINRHPESWPDWTHSNAILYSKDDGNILVSSRHQSWVMKVNYKDGAGDGTILWKLGYQGDFTLVGGTDPIDWQYSQHEPSFFTSNTTGVFGLVLMDNGDLRVTGGNPCNGPGGSCNYSRAPEFMIDETAMTATISNTAIFSVFNPWGGNAEVLDNGDIEADYCGMASGSIVVETTPGANPQTVWSMSSSNNDYRSHRIGSFYPGVTWTSDALKFQAEHATHPNGLKPVVNKPMTPHGPQGM
jgi:hypothetical protein